MVENIIETHGVGKEFNGVWVLRDINFTLRKGEIHALIGENGAGKSTFIKILSGVYSKSAGEILINGNVQNFANVKQSEGAGIRTVHQEIQLVPTFKVYQNIFIGTETSRNIAGFQVMQDRDMRRCARQVLDQLNCSLDENTVTAHLNTSHKKIVEISKVLLYKPQVIIFDEPTTALGEAERETLLKTIQGLKESGIAIIYISHNLEEIQQIADRVTVFRDGCKVAELEGGEISIDTIIKNMLGDKTYNSYRRQHSYAGEDVILETTRLSTEKLKEVSFQVHRGEILGFAGVVGAGKTELAQALFGMDKVLSGGIIYKGVARARQSVQMAIKQGIALVPEERQAQGIIPNYSILKNMTLTYMEKWSPLCIFNHEAELDCTKQYIQRMSIKTTGPGQLIRNLSGGNQQKVILSRWMAGDFELGIFDEPTKGIDIKAKEDIYMLMDEMAKAGKGIIMMSSYLPELLAICDRIIVLHEGEVVGEFSPAQEDAERKITTVMLGGHS